ncbi:MAG: hypothetical protein Q9183_001729 [Haloplaca sp. 2 TL-2023]
MSSIFTFDPDPPKALISPWPVLTGGRLANPQTRIEAGDGDDTPNATTLADFGVVGLKPEPQDGPTEYKLHLLLRPRRSYSALSTVQRVSGSHLSRLRQSRSEIGTTSPSPKPPITPASSNQSRQARLQNLTTQLLWRLQQSSPHHSASRNDLVVPILPEFLDSLVAPRNPGKLLPGLGDSQGALYEIGVADDGTLVGLTVDELDESLGVLRAMASSLGCRVQLRQKIVVGDCQWLEDSGAHADAGQISRTEKLWVAEALVSPDMDTAGLEDTSTLTMLKSVSNPARLAPVDGNQSLLRVSLTGSTTCGKTSLLGTLSTSTLDNGRGKSRLSLLKHRHEIASGVTSSVTGSLIGYHDAEDYDHNQRALQVINYASGNISSWTDIHSASDPGRLVFLNDSAGHPKFRRTIVRGLVSWAPHWTMCCIAADNEKDTSGQAGATASASDVLGAFCAEMDLATAHLELCLNLGLPLIVVVTKLDLATMSALKPMLGKILSVLKSAGRRPEILSSPSDESSFSSQLVSPKDEREIQRLLSGAPDVRSLVPIVLTSAVTGKGIDKLHALLRHLPIPPRLSVHDEYIPPMDETLASTSIFHVDEIFAARETHLRARQGSTDLTVDPILSGHLGRGSLAIGQEVAVGPFAASPHHTDLSPPEVHRASSYPKFRGSPKINSPRRILPRPLSGDFSVASQPEGESTDRSQVWRRARICSIRNLRLPVHSLSSDQAGTIGLCHPATSTNLGPVPLNANDRIRKGMVLMSLPTGSDAISLPAYNGFIASFEASKSSKYHPGMFVIAYMASIRAPAQILHSQILQTDVSTLTSSDVLGVTDAGVGGGKKDVADGSNATENQAESDVKEDALKRIKMTFQFTTYQEYFEAGTQVLVTPASPAGSLGATSEGGDKPTVGLEGLVGRIEQGLA